MKISKAAQAAGCHLETVRYYERIGLLPEPDRTQSGYRSYSEDDVERLRFVARCRDLGFDLKEIRSLLQLDQDPTLTCDEVTAIASRHLEAVQARIRDLDCVALELKRAISSCGGSDRAHCTVLDALKHARPVASSERAA